MTLPYELDTARDADLPALQALLGELLAQERDFTPDPAKQARGLRLILDDPARGQLFVARGGGEVIAMASVLFTISTAEGGRVGLLEDVIVASAHRGQGVGKRLLEHVLAWCWRQGLSRLTLMTDHDNAPAQALYERAGFRRSAMWVMRRWRDGVGE